MLYPALLAELAEATGLDGAQVRGGRLSVALSEAEEAALRETLRWQRDLGFDVAWLDGDATRGMAPALAPAIRGAIWCAAASGVRAAALTLALARAAEARGATIREGTPVEGFLRGGGGSRGSGRPVATSARARRSSRRGHGRRRSASCSIWNCRPARCAGRCWRWPTRHRRCGRRSRGRGAS